MVTSNIEGAKVVGAPPAARFKMVVNPSCPSVANVCVRLSVNSTPHLNRAKVKKTALEMAAQLRPANKFSRVGMSFIERIEARVRAAIVEEIKQHPSKGVTLL